MRVRNVSPLSPVSGVARGMGAGRLMVESPAPVEIIRGLASEFLDHQSPKARNKYPIVGTGEDIVSKGIVTESQAQELLDMYPPISYSALDPSPHCFSITFLVLSDLSPFIHRILTSRSFIKEYGKWIGFPPLPTLLNHLRHHSPLLLTATSLIASRHLPTTPTLDTHVTSLFAESRRLLSLALLNVPRNVETLQAILILSVWSPLAKREATPQNRPLQGGRTLDSWLVSGYGVMLGMTVIRFNDLTRGVSAFRGPRTPVGGGGKENNPDGVSQRLRVWNHLCLIHLQYVPSLDSPLSLQHDPRFPCFLLLSQDLSSCILSTTSHLHASIHTRIYF